MKATSELSKQHCRDLVLWPVIDIMALVKDCASCLVSKCTLLTPAAATVAIDNVGAHPAGYLWWAPQRPTSPILPPCGLRHPLKMARDDCHRNTITSDNGSQFISAELVAFVEEKGINTSTHLSTTPRWMEEDRRSQSRKNENSNALTTGQRHPQLQETTQVYWC